MALVLLTNVTQYAGPGALDGLLAEGHNVACHDASFADAGTRAGFDDRQGKMTAFAGQSPEDIHDEIMARLGLPDAIVSNDVYPITRNEIEAIPADDLRRTFEAIVLTPVRLTQLFLPAMKRRRKGAFVFVTSARETRPEPGFAVPTTLRAATTAFAKALARRRHPSEFRPMSWRRTISIASFTIHAPASSTTRPAARPLRSSCRSDDSVNRRRLAL